MTDSEPLGQQSQDPDPAVVNFGVHLGVDDSGARRDWGVHSLGAELLAR